MKSLADIYARVFPASKRHVNGVLEEMRNQEKISEEQALEIKNLKQEIENLRREIGLLGKELPAGFERELQEVRNLALQNQKELLARQMESRSQMQELLLKSNEILQNGERQGELGRKKEERDKINERKKKIRDTVKNSGGGGTGFGNEESGWSKGCARPDIMFFSPPYWDVYAPFSAVPCLAARLREENYKVEQVDLGIYSIRRLLAKKWKQAAGKCMSEYFFENRVKPYVRNTYETLEQYREALWFFQGPDFSIDKVKGKILGVKCRPARRFRCVLY